MSNQDQSPGASPGGLGNMSVKGDPRIGGGVRRLNRLPMMIGFGMVFILIMAVLYTVYQKSHHGQALSAASPEKIGSAGMPSELASTMPSSGEIAQNVPIPADPGPTRSVDSNRPMNGNAVIQKGATLNEGSRLSDDVQATGSRVQSNGLSQRDWSAYLQEQQAIDARHRQAAATALNAGSAVKMPRNGQGSEGPAPSIITSASQGDTAGMLAAAAGHPTGAGAAVSEPNGQQAKREFLATKPEQVTFLPYKREPPMTSHDIKAGTVIPGIMVSGLNSDLPGQMIAEVRENVYDTATGTILIIPQGAKLLGTYDNGVTYGQSRALTAWRRIIYPDASSVSLDTMPGADPGGYAGFSDHVDNHFVRLFSSAILMSAFSAGIQLSQPQPTTGSTGGTGYSSQQIVAASLGQQLGELGMEITRKNLEVQPTIQIRPGYLFNIIVTKDLILEPWTRK